MLFNSKTMWLGDKNVFGGHGLPAPLNLSRKDIVHIKLHKACLLSTNGRRGIVDSGICC